MASWMFKGGSSKQLYPVNKKSTLERLMTDETASDVTLIILIRLEKNAVSELNGEITLYYK